MKVIEGVGSNQAMCFFFLNRGNPAVLIILIDKAHHAELNVIHDTANYSMDT